MEHHDHNNMAMTTTMMPHHTPVDHSMHNMSTTMNHAHHHPTTTPMDHSAHGGAHGGSHGDGDMPGHMMQMYFHTGISEYILFEGLLTSSTGGIIGACFAMFALSIAYEGLKYVREYLLRRAAIRHTYSPSTNDQVLSKQPPVGSRMLSGSHGIQTVLHMVQVFISYCLMLVFMTYNVWLCLSIVLGAGLGYFMFGWRRAMVVDINEHCH